MSNELNKPANYWICFQVVGSSTIYRQEQVGSSFEDCISVIKSLQAKHELTDFWIEDENSSRMENQ